VICITNGVRFERMKNMRNKVIKILEDVCDSTEIRENPDVDLFEAGLLDSLATVSLLLEMETVFGLVLEPTDVSRPQISSVNNIVAFLNSKGIS